MFTLFTFGLGVFVHYICSMAAPKGNQFWKNRSKHGRDKLFASPELLWEAACEYFDWVDNNPLHCTDSKVKRVKGRRSKQLEETEDETKIRPLKRPYQLVGLCLYIGASEAFFRYMKSAYDPEMDEDFLTVIDNVEAVILNQQFEGAASGQFNAAFIGKALGMVDKKDLSSTDGSMTPKETTVVVKDQKTADNIKKLIDGD